MSSEYDRSKPEAEYVVIGAGLAGMAAAAELSALGREAVVLEKDEEVGGLTRTLRIGEFAFDYSGHLLHLSQPDVASMVERTTDPHEWSLVERRSAVLLDDAVVPYPFQQNLSYASERIRDNCLATLPTEADTGEWSVDRSLAEWAYANLGAGLAETFMIPYNEKLLGMSANEISCRALGRFLPTPALDEIRKGAIQRQAEQVGYNAKFRYPKRGGIDLLPQAIATKVPSVSLRSNVVAIDTNTGEVQLSDGRAIRYVHRLLSTMPLPELCAAVGDEALRERAAKLPCASVWCVNLGVKTRPNRLSGIQWTYLPEPQFNCYRAGNYAEFSRNCAPAGFDAWYMEISHDGALSEGDAVQQAIDDLVRMGVIEGASAVVVSAPVNIHYAYTVRTTWSDAIRDELLSELHLRGIDSFGRYGKWEYSAMEDALIAGIQVAREVAGQAP